MKNALLIFICSGLGATPYFRADRVLPANHSRHIPLAPGMLMSIYGEDLGPAEGCVAGHDQRGVYPQTLCQVQVTVAGVPGELLYVSEKQINFKVPAETGSAGEAAVQVIYRGEASAEVMLELGIEKTTLSLEQPAFVGMPVWLHVEFPLQRGGSLRYPSALGPAGFGCNTVEARRNGVPLPQLDGSNWGKHGMVISGSVCGSFSLSSDPRFENRLPLHLLYRFDTPGKYEVRFIMKSFPDRVLASTDWTTVEILPARPNQRAAWLQALSTREPADAGEVLSDLLPSILGFPDEASFNILLEYLYHPENAVRTYASRGLFYWPEDYVARRLVAEGRVRPPSDVITHFLQWSKR